MWFKNRTNELIDSIKAVTGTRTQSGRRVEVKSGDTGSKPGSNDYRPISVARNGDKVEVRVAPIAITATDEDVANVRRAALIMGESVIEDDGKIESIPDYNHRLYSGVFDGGRIRNKLVDSYPGDKVLFAGELGDIAPALKNMNAADALAHLIALNKATQIDSDAYAALLKVMEGREDIQELYDKVKHTNIINDVLHAKTKEQVIKAADDYIKFLQSNDAEPPPPQQGGGKGASGGKPGDENGGKGKGSDGDEDGEDGDSPSFGKPGEVGSGPRENLLNGETPYLSLDKPRTYTPEDVDVDTVDIRFDDFTDPATKARTASAGWEAAKFAEQNDNLGSELRRMLQVRSAAHYESNLRRGKIDRSKVYKICVPTVGSGDWNARIFRKKKQSDCLDTAVLILVDCSGSMSGKKYHLAAASAIIVADALDALHVNFEIMGFTCESRLNVLPFFKKFNEPYNKPMLMGGLYTMEHRLENNPDAVAVHVATTRIMQQKNKRRIIITLSDGQPCCPLPNGREALVGAVKRATELGVETFGIGILSDAVQEYYPKYKVLKNADDLTSTLVGVLDTTMM